MYSPRAMAASPFRPDRPIVLVGLMGAGKSTVGRRLAKRLGLAFVDSDEEIEKAADRSVAEIFDEHGEASFRDGERRVIARWSGEPKVTRRRGAFVDARTRALILAHCTSSVDADIETLADRCDSARGEAALEGRTPSSSGLRAARTRSTQKPSSVRSARDEERTARDVERWPPGGAVSAVGGALGERSSSGSRRAARPGGRVCGS